ncbi:MAG: twin-arginine translocase TatA/TatE family subunit [Planctomycetaceae bacterium]|nr:twin-arginine translocase TatA/TatE family subunit [Planctomycetaceae bacterium]
MPGIPELLIVMVVMLLLFGHRLPSMMRSLGRGVVKFKKGVAGVEDEFEDAKKSIDSDD